MSFAKLRNSVCWEVGDATFEIMCQLMYHNSCHIIGIYDELTTFLTQLNVTKEKDFLVPMNYHYFCNCIMDMDGTEAQVIHKCVIMLAMLPS